MGDRTNSFRVIKYQRRLSDAQVGLSNECNTKKPGVDLHSDPKTDPNRDENVIELPLGLTSSYFLGDSFFIKIYP